MTIWGPGRTEYHFIWRSDVAAFGTLAAASAVAAAQQYSPGIMTGWRDMLQRPSVASYPDKDIVSEMAGLLANGTILSRVGAFDPVWRHPSAGSRDRTLSLQFLKKFRGDSGTIGRFRSLLSEKNQGASLYRLSDDEVFAGIATLLGSGELVVGFRSHQYSDFATHDDAPAPRTDPAGTPPPRSTSPPVEHEDPTFSNHDASTQAATLIVGSKKGAPFCEVCEAAAKAG